MPSKAMLSFSDAATLAKEKIDPAVAGDVRYIGLEHIEPDSLCLSGYGHAEDVGSAKAAFKKGDILFGKLRPYFRKVVIAPFDGICSTDIWVVRAKKNVDQAFLYYWMASQEFVDGATRGSEGTRMPRAKWDYVSRFHTPITDKKEKKAIGEVLGALDHKIALNRQMCETLEKTAAALFHSWFVDFDPVKAKMEGRTPEGMSAELLSLFPDRFEDSSIGLIPKGWKVVRLDEMLVLQRGFDLPASQRTKGKYQILAASGPSGGHDEYMVEGPGVTTGRSGVLGNVFYVHKNFWPLNTSLWVKSFKHCSPVYAYFLLKGIDFLAFNAGSAVPTLNRNHIHNLPTLKPPRKIIEKYDEVAALLFSAIEDKKDEIKTLVATRDTLLPKLISGELRVENVEG